MNYAKLKWAVLPPAKPGPQRKGWRFDLVDTVDDWPQETLSKEDWISLLGFPRMDTVD